MTVDRRRRLRVLLVEPDRRVRQALHSLLSAEPDMQICAAAGTAAAALALARTERPDVALTEMLLPSPEDGIGLVEELSRQGLPVLVLTAAARMREQARRCGAVAFLEKDGQVEEIMSALRSVPGWDGHR
jgi:DNA-binding NarL/FixJ family response regulator